jgi:hypothetical protein
VSGLARGVVFPLPKLAMPLASSSTSHRVRQRLGRAVATTTITNDAIHALNSLHFSASTAKHLQTRNSLSIPKSSFRALAHVHSCAQRFVERLAPGPCADSLPLEATREPFAAAYAFRTDAVPLVAGRVALPEHPGGCNLLDVLPDDLARKYSYPNPELFRPLHEQEKAPG